MHKHKYIYKHKHEQKHIQRCVRIMHMYIYIYTYILTYIHAYIWAIPKTMTHTNIASLTDRKRICRGPASGCNLLKAGRCPTAPSERSCCA